MIDPEKVLKELADLWAGMGKQDTGNGAGVLRACAMTLVVAASEDEDPAGIWETLAALMPEHPSRAILVRLRPGADGEPAARVFAQCWMPFGQRRQICCEQVEIAASEAALPDLAPALLPLAAPDLPVVLWCRSARLAAAQGFAELAGMAGKIVVDTAAWPDPGAALATLAAWAREGRLVADLAWTRLTRWRELIARVFENRDHLARLAGVSEVRVAFTGGAAPVVARYLGAWLAGAVREAGGNPRLGFESAAGEGTLAHVELRGPDFVMSATRTEGQCAEVRVGELVNRISLPRPAEHTLMAEELGIPGRDPVFERVLAAAT